MLGEELILAARAPHDLIMIDGTLTLPVIYFNQAISQSASTPELECSQKFRDSVLSYLDGYLAILQSERTDKNFTGLPKYSTRREIGKAIGWPTQWDDRALLSLLLEAGEYTTLLRLEQPSQEWHIYVSGLAEQDSARVKVDRITNLLREVQVSYYKPHPWLPALRIEVPYQTAMNSFRLASVMQGIKHQCATPSMLEPYPLYLADRTVKALARALPAFRQAATQQISARYTGNIGEIYFAMHGYRTEAGV
jgi:hypothetical protein